MVTITRVKVNISISCFVLLTILFSLWPLVANLAGKPQLLTYFGLLLEQIFYFRNTIDCPPPQLATLLPKIFDCYL